MYSNDPYIKTKKPFEYTLPPYWCKCLVPCTRTFAIRTEGVSSVGTFNVFLCENCSRQIRIKLFLIMLLPLLVFITIAVIRRELFWVIPGMATALVGLWLMSKGYLSPAFSDGYSIQFRNIEYQKRFEEANADGR